MDFSKLNRLRYLPVLKYSLQSRYYTKYVFEIEIKKCYAILGISENSDQETIRGAYLNLVKKFHPDSGQPDADSEKFHEIDKAFKILLTKKSKERWSADEVNFEVHAQIFDLKHTAPQHRQYLNYEGIGTGNPFQREKEYEKFRTTLAAESVLNHRINKSQADDKAVLEKSSQKHKIKTKYGYDRLVEDLIQESMSKGEFDNLSGKGKPLKEINAPNPYVDFTTHKLNQVLLENGFTPEWIMLQKDIRHEKALLTKILYESRQHLDTHPFDASDAIKWRKILENCQNMVNEINKKIEKFNLVVPLLQKQMLQINFEKIADEVAKHGKTRKQIEEVMSTEKNESTINPKNIFGLLESFFIKH